MLDISSAVVWKASALVLTNSDFSSGFAIGEWEVLPAQGLLRSGDRIERPEPRVLAVLIALAQRNGDVVTRDELVAELWDGRPTSDEPINRCISRLRGHLGDRATPHRYIETLSRRGYRLLEEVRPLVPDAAAEHSLLARKRNRLYVAGLAGIALVMLGGWWGYVGQKNEPAPAIGVLPFKNLSGDPAQEYFSDGISDELLSLLARIPEIRVISRTSAFSYKGKNVRLEDIAKDLNVTHVLEGSVRRSGDRVRITAQLINARSDTQLWSHVFDSEFDDIFAIQEEIATTVVQQLRIRLVDEPPHLRKTSPEAYALYLHAQYLARQLTQESLLRSNELFREVLALDPGYAPAWDGIANNYVFLGGYGMMPIDEGFALAKSAIEQALALDPELAHAHALLGRLARGYDNDLAASARHYERAMELDPTHDDNLRGAAVLLASLGRLEEATAFNEYAVLRDPLNPVSYSNLGMGYLFVGRWDDAIDACRIALRLAPDHLGAHYCVGEALLFDGDAESAVDAFEQESFESLRLIGLAMAYHALGRSDEADDVLAELIDNYEDSWAAQIAFIYDYRGETDEAFEWLEKAVEYRDPGVSEIFTGTLYFANARKDPRWLPFLESIGHAPHQLAAIEFNVPALPLDRISDLT